MLNLWGVRFLQGRCHGQDEVRQVWALIGTAVVLGSVSGGWRALACVGPRRSMKFGQSKVFGLMR